MNSQELAEILENYKRLECLNPRAVKNVSKPKIEEKLTGVGNNQTVSQTHRKKSLPLLNCGNHSKSNGKKAPKSKMLMFHNDRSFSSNNISLLKNDNKSCLKDQLMVREYMNKERNKSPNTSPKSNTKVLFSITHENPNATLDENDHYVDVSNLDLETFIDIRDQILLKPKNSLEIKTYLNKSHSQKIEHIYSNGILSEEFNTNQKSTPELLRNSTGNPACNQKMMESSNDSGLSNGIINNKLDFPRLPSPNLHDPMNSSESFSDISDTCPATFGNIDSNSLDKESPTITDQSDQNIISSIKMDSLTDKTFVETEKEKMKLFKKIAMDLSMKTFSTKEIIWFYKPDGTSTAQVIDISQTAFSVCTLLKKRFNIDAAAYCQIVEVIQAETLERPLEDHENILTIYYSWKEENTSNRFLFQENSNMYKIFSKPFTFTAEMECDFEINDTIWVKESCSRWRKLYCFISDTSVYFKLKVDSKDHKDLYSLVNLKKYDVFTCTDVNRIKKSFKAPTNELIIFMSNKLEHKSQDHPCLCFYNSLQKERWLEALKVAKFSFNQLKDNYLNFEKNIETNFSDNNRTCSQNSNGSLFNLTNPNN